MQQRHPQDAEAAAEAVEQCYQISNELLAAAKNENMEDYLYF